MPALAKLTRPKVHRVLARERLFQRMDESRERPLIWVVAPPGAGKTTLVASYLEARKLRSAWYQVDAGDDDVGTFFYYLAQTVPNTRSKHAQPLPLLTPELRGNLSAYSRIFFRAYFERLPQPAALVLDNYHELAVDASLHQVVETAVAEAPEGINIVAISRTEPPRDLMLLKLNERMASIDWSHLRLSLDETRALASQRVQLDEVSVQRIHRFADGWAAGVALSVQRSNLSSETHGAPRHEDTAAMFDYFAAQLLRQATPEMQRFLIRTALLPTLTAESADQMSDSTNSAILLEELHRRGLFTNRRATRPPVYQYHDLFRSFLLAQFEATVPATERQQLQRRAGALLEQTGHPDHAIRFYIDVKDWDDAKRALLAAAPSLLGQARSESLRDWIRLLPSSHADDPWIDYWLGAALARLTPPLARAPLARAWQAVEGRDEIVLKRLLCADMILTYAFEYSDFSPLDRWGKALIELLALNAPFALVVAELHVYTACLFALGQRLPRTAEIDRCIGRILQLIDHESVPVDLAAVSLGFILVQHFSVGSLREGAQVARRLDGLIQKSALSPMVNAMSWIQLGHFALRSGECARARAALEQGLEVARVNALDLPMLRIFSNLGLAFEALQRSDLAQAERHQRAMEEASTPDRKTDRVGILRIHFWLACHRNQWELAHVLAEQQVLLARECGLFVVMFECYTLLAYTCAQTQRKEQMESALAEVESLISGTAFDHFRYHLDLARAYYALLVGDRVACHRWLSAGLQGTRVDEGRFILRMQPLVFSSLLGEALQAGIDAGYATQLIVEMGMPPPPTSVESWPWPIRIYTLGRFEIQRLGQPLEFSRKAPKKTLALLKAIIAFGGKNVREQLLLDAFWSDEEGDVATRSLTAALHRLRTLLGDNDAVLQQGGTLSINASRVWVDVWSFEEQLTRTDSLDSETLLRLYRGGFLVEDEGEPWSVTMRERMRGKFIHALVAQTQKLEAEGSYQRAIECYLRGLDADPVIEQFYQGLMRSYTRLDRKSEAIAAYRRLKQMLSIVLSLKPSASTEKLYQSLRLEQTAS